MFVDFQKEVDKRRGDILADLFRILQINSERDDSKADKKILLGPALFKLLNIF